MARSQEHTNIGPLVLLIVGGIIAILVMGATQLNKTQNMAYRSQAAGSAHCTAIGDVYRGQPCCGNGVVNNFNRCARPTSTPIPGIKCNYYTLSTCLSSTSCNKTTSLCTTDKCGLNPSGKSYARCVLKSGTGGAPPQGSECKLFNINGQQRYGCVTKEGFCPRGGNASSQFDSYCIGGICSGTTNRCIANKWILTPTPKPTATPVEHGNRFQTCDKVSDVGSYFKHLCISANDCSCTIRWRCRATCATVGVRFCWNYKWDKSDTTCTPVRPDLCSPEPGFVCEP